MTGRVRVVSEGGDREGVVRVGCTSDSEGVLLVVGIACILVGAQGPFCPPLRIRKKTSPTPSQATAAPSASKHYMIFSGALPRGNYADGAVQGQLMTLQQALEYCEAIQDCGAFAGGPLKQFSLDGGAFAGGPLKQFSLDGGAFAGGPLKQFSLDGAGGPLKQFSLDSAVVGGAETVKKERSASTRLGGGDHGALSTRPVGGGGDHGAASTRLGDGDHGSTAFSSQRSTSEPLSTRLGGGALGRKAGEEVKHGGRKIRGSAGVAALEEGGTASVVVQAGEEAAGQTTEEKVATEKGAVAEVAETVGGEKVRFYFKKDADRLQVGSHGGTSKGGEGGWFVYVRNK